MAILILNSHVGIACSNSYLNFIAERTAETLADEGKPELAEWLLADDNLHLGAYGHLDIRCFTPENQKLFNNALIQAFERITVDISNKSLPYSLPEGYTALFQALVSQLERYNKGDIPKQWENLISIPEYDGEEYGPGW